MIYVMSDIHLLYNTEDGRYGEVDEEERIMYRR